MHNPYDTNTYPEIIPDNFFETPLALEVSPRALVLYLRTLYYVHNHGMDDLGELPVSILQRWLGDDFDEAFQELIDWGVWELVGKFCVFDKRACDKRMADMLNA